jgi:hypothetical protein
MSKKRNYNSLQLDPRKYRYLIGVDVSFYSMGLAIRSLEVSGMPPELITGDMDDILQRLALYHPSETLLVVEYIQTGYLGNNPGVVRNVAQAIAASSYFCYLLNKYNYVYLKVDPGQRDRMDTKGRKRKKGQLKPIQLASMPTKITDQQYYQLTGIYGVFSEHAKDAYTLIHNRKPTEIIAKIKIQLSKENNK